LYSEGVGSAEAAKRLAAAAAYGGGGLSLLGASLYGVLRAEATLARRTIGNADGEPPTPTGWYGLSRPGPPVKMALLGDSSAAGYGVERVEETPGARLASGVSEAAGRRCYLSSVAFVGAQSKDLAAQIDKVLPMEPQLALILIGANDVTHAVRPAQSVRLLREGVVRLRSARVEVVVGTCPDLGTIEPLPPPLRQVARAWSQRLAAAQTIAVVESGGRTVSLASILGPEFQHLADVLFGPDRFHPSVAGYARLTSVLLPSTLAALGVVPDDEAPLEVQRGEGVLPISKAAVEAARTPGVEVEPAGKPPQGGLPWGRFVQLRRRRRQPETDIEPPRESPDATVDPDDQGDLVTEGAGA
jgi:lysophospholipase L1-like esterase